MTLRLSAVIGLLAIFGSAFTLRAQARSEVLVSHEEFLALVCRGNLALASERLKVPIARAEAKAAAVFADPSLSLEYANNEDWSMKMGQSISAGLGYTLSPGKRGARVNLANSETALAEALLDDYLRNLRYEASTAYYETVRLGELMTQAHLLAHTIDLVATLDSVRQARGEIRSADALQTRREANKALAEYINARTDYDNARVALGAMTGGADGPIVYYTPTSSLDFSEPDCTLEQLVNSALEKRTDLVAALKNVETARRAQELAGKERNMDFDLSLGYSYNTEARNEMAPSPRHSSLSIGVAIPLQFSNSNKGALTAARLRTEQAELDYERARTEVRTQTVQAYNTYQAAIKRARTLDARTSERSRNVFEEYRRSYAEGEIDINDFLDTIHNYTDIATMAIDSRAARMAAFLALRHAAALD